MHSFWNSVALAFIKHQLVLDFCALVHLSTCGHLNFPFFNSAAVYVYLVCLSSSSTASDENVSLCVIVLFSLTAVSFQWFQ